MNLQKEFESLAKAEEDIRLADERIEQQRRLTEQLKRDGHDTSTALEVLTVLCETREAMVNHKELIVEHIRRITSEQNKA
ncbi:hypothetical protein [Paraburkholderia sp.]|jgi:hypothetical protein|uniref:hypothetical protein n=1 Tax=Paraburkholderia sp. TaxID=1926495 RepID=UPI002F422BC2